MMRLRTTVLIMALLSTGLVHADERKKTQQQVAQTQQEIAELKKLLQAVQKERSGVEKALKETESQIGNLERKINSLEEQKKNSETELGELEADQERLSAQREEQLKLIAIQARAAHQSGKQEPLRLLLNQESPEQLARHLTYYQFLGQARHEQITQYNQLSSQLEEVEVGILNQQNLLTQQQQELTNEKSTLDDLRKQRQKKIAELASQQKKHQGAISRKEKDQQELEQVLVTIEAELQRQARERERQRLLAEQRRLEEQQRLEKARLEQQRLARLEAQRKARQQAIEVTQLAPETPIPPTVTAISPTRPNPVVSTPKAIAPSEPIVIAKAQPEVTAQKPANTANYLAASTPFSAARGKLPWPVKGNLSARFGSPRSDTRSKWDGVLISARAGTPVQAVHAGRVVFADWLRGAGQLIIIDHGDGYLSLYGHNQTLQAQVGDTVQPGQVIATVGNSGGHTTNALYFAIRQKGRATDPAQWFRNQG